ncbi:MAG: adenylate/guanylate cyclase domain-containing protein [Gemmataceae bacterium]|nr:adenylate/guanylate cyclase domain-containing protein [Gemmataceae bacterium]
MSFVAFLSRPSWRGVRLGLICALIVWLLSRTDFARGLEDWALDGCFCVRGTRPTETRIVIIGLDEASLDELHKPYALISPELAEVVGYVDKQGAAAVGLDVLVPQSQSGLGDIASPGAPGDPRALGALIHDFGNVILPQYHLEGGWQRPLLQWRLKQERNPEFGDLAFVNFTEDGDQFVRRQQLLLHDQPAGPLVPQFALAVLARARRESVDWDDARKQLRLGGRRIPLDDKQCMRINYVGAPGTFPVLPFKDALKNARVGQSMPQLKGAIVLIGLTARGQHDYYATPYSNIYAREISRDPSGQMNGTELQANIIATLADQAFITTPAWLDPLVVVVIVGAALGWMLARLSMEWGLVLVGTQIIGWQLIALAAFRYLHWRIELGSIQVLGLVVFGATFAQRWRSLRQMLGVVKSEAIAMALEADPSQLDRRGEEREVTILFADIRSFTDFSEAHTPHEVVELLNAYFTAIVPAIEAEQGTINTYMGDGVMVVFGAPTSCPDHALRGANAAVAMVRRVHQLKDRWAKLGYPGMRIGVGVHTGKVVVGAIGSPRRLDYTAIGDAVNAASRIESENKRLHTEVLISAVTYAALPNEARARLGCATLPVDAMVKGKQQVLQLYPIEVP